jgi:hypothetical protein
MKDIKTRVFSKKNMRNRLGGAPSFLLEDDEEEDFPTVLHDQGHAAREGNQTFGYSTGGSTSIGLDTQEDTSVTDGLPTVRRTNLSGSGKLVQHISYIDNGIIPYIPQISSEPTFLKAAMHTTNGQDQDESGGTKDVHVVGTNGLTKYL